MECTLAALVACFSWSGLYLDVGGGYQQSRSYHINDYQYEFRFTNPGIIETGGFRTHEKTEFEDFGYGRALIGYEISMSNVRLALEGAWTKDLQHGSGTTKSIGLSLRLYPFRRN